MDVEKFIVIEKHISEAEDKQADAQRESLRARWEFGKEMLAERGDKKQLPNGMLDKLCAATNASRSELKYRAQFAEKFPTESEVAKALATFKSWTQIIKNLSNVGKKKPAAPKEKVPPRRHPQHDEVADLDRQGLTRPEIAEATGVNVHEVRKIVERDRVEREVKDAATVIDWATLDEPAKVKEARMRKQIRRELEAELEPTIQAEVQARIGASFKNAQQMHTEAKLVLEARKGVMTKADFQLILACLHPDNSASTEKRARAFDLFRRSEIVLLDERNSPAVTSLPSMEELLKRRASKK